MIQPTINRPKKFFNKMQRDAMAVSAHDERYVCARGTGKSEGLDARFIVQNVWAMPGSLGSMLTPTYSKAWQNTLPAICHALYQWGYVKDIHYFVGRKAPKQMGFQKPKREPLSYENAFHFWNGTVMIVLSFNQSMSANSMSLDWVLGPEAKFLDHDKIKNEVNPANRGNRQYFDNSPWHHSTMFTTDMPTSKKGSWILNEKDKMNEEHINYIRVLYKEYITEKYRIPYEERTDYEIRKLKELEADLNFARKYRPLQDTTTLQTKEYTLYYSEYDIFDNLEVVGEEYIWQMKRDSPPLIWRTAFLNERLGKIVNGFYSALEEKIHFYIPNDSGRLSRFGDDFAQLQKTGCLADDDLDFDKPLYIAFDSNAAITSMVIGQVDKSLNLMRTIKSMFVKTPSKMAELVKAFSEYYENYLRREVIVYYDHTFVWSDGKTGDTLIGIIERELKAAKWKYNLVYVGQAPKHVWKHEQIDIALKGTGEYLFPMFNQMNNEYLKIAMERTGVRMGNKGFEKDKREEAIDDSPELPDQIKTHITDAWDTLWYGLNFYYTTSVSTESMVGIF